MTSATLGGGCVNQILTFADRGERGDFQKSDILLNPTDGGGGGEGGEPEVADTKGYFG